MRTTSLGLLLLAACGDSGGTAIDASPSIDVANPMPDAPLGIDAAPGTFTLTSPSLAEGGAFPASYTCHGTNVSPQLVWPASTGAASYAVTLVDMSNMLPHWAIFDIATTTLPLGLPEHVDNLAMPAAPANAVQVKSYDNATFGYRGPCPPNVHTYQFTVYALDVAHLPGVTSASTRAQVIAAIAPHALANATLTGTSN